jgi:hypothetical protein
MYGYGNYGFVTSAKLVAEDPRLAELDGKIKAAIAAMWRSPIFSRTRRNYEKLANDLKRERTELRTQLKRTVAGQKYEEKAAAKKAKRDAKLAKKQGLTPDESVDLVAESDVMVSADIPAQEAIAAAAAPPFPVVPVVIGVGALVVAGIFLLARGTRKPAGGGKGE